MQKDLGKFTFLALLITSAVTAQQCSSEWTSRGDSCYKWFSQPQYWFDAEQICRFHQGHLVSIQSQHENTLVARLAQCKTAWIGRFGTNLNKLNDTTSYAWTDGSDPVSFERHKFTQLNSVHKPLIRSDGEWWINSLYHERHPFVCERAFTQGNRTLSCPNGWSLYNNHCYLMPDFESNFNEANFYCQRKSSQLVSVLNEPELNNINRLIFGIDSCDSNPIDTVWLGLIKLNPCFPDSGGRELCYQWTDFSGKHVGFPIWQLGHPNNSDWTVNCVTLRGDRLYSEACYNRHRFVCKSPARNDTDGGGSGSVDGVVAAFDFRKGLHNLVNPNTYLVRNDVNVSRSPTTGACFSPNTRYRIGNSLRYGDTFLSNQQWTIFVRAKTEHLSNWAYIISASDTNATSGSPPPFWVELYNSNYNNTQIFTHEFEYEQKGNMTLVHRNGFELENRCHNSWCNYAIAAKNYRSVFTVNQRSSQGNHITYSHAHAWPRLVDIVVGQPPYWPKQATFCVSCFGIVDRQMNSTELNRVFKTFCPSEN